MTTTTAPMRNGVDTAQVYGTLDALKADAGLARLRVAFSIRGDAPREKLDEIVEPRSRARWSTTSSRTPCAWT